MNGRVFDAHTGRFTLHGVAGCMTAEVGGGKCGPGALSAAFTKAVSSSGLMDGINKAAEEGDWGARTQGTLIAAVVGGTGSVLGGGKFANGAQTGAFGYLFNQIATRPTDVSCSADGRSCAMRTAEERIHYTGKSRLHWNPIDWDDPSLMKTFSVDVMALLPGVASKLPGFELRGEAATQRGEVLHEARVDRQCYRVTVIDQVETSRISLNYVQGNSFRWVSNPVGPTSQHASRFKAV